MGLLNLLSTLSSATATPDNNPYYGAQLLKPSEAIDPSHTWIDASGNPITDTSHLAALNANPQLASQPYNTPSFWSKLGNVGQEEQRANMAASGLLGQAQNARAIARTTTGEDVATLPQNMLQFPNNPQASVTAALNPWANPTNLKNQGEAEGALNTGLVGQTGANTQQAANNVSQFGINQSKFNLEQQSQAQDIARAQQELDFKQIKNIAPLQYAHALSEWTAANHRQPKENERNAILANVQLQQAKVAKQIQSNVGQTAINQAGTDMLNSKVANKVAVVSDNNSGLIANTVGNNLLKANWDSSRQSPSTTPLSAPVNSDTGTIGLPSRDPLYASPMAMSMMGMQAMNSKPGVNVGGIKGAVNTVGWKPNLSTEENISHQEEAAKAHHDAKQAAIDAEISKGQVEQKRLKALKAATKAEHLTGISAAEYNGYTTPAPEVSNSQAWWDANSPQTVSQPVLIGKPQKVGPANSLFNF